MSPQESGQFVCKAFDEFIGNQPSDKKWDALRERLFTWFCSLDEPLAFEGMLWVFEHCNRYQYQQLAGYLLIRRNVPLMISCEIFIRKIAPRLDASSNEVVRYLRAQVGNEAALQQVEAIARVATDKQLLSSLEKMRYWLDRSKGAPSVEAP